MSSMQFGDAVRLSKCMLMILQHAEGCDFRAVKCMLMILQHAELSDFKDVRSFQKNTAVHIIKAKF